MRALVWLDVPLLVLGLLAMSPRLRQWYRRRRSVGAPPRGRGWRTATALLFFLGFASLMMAGVDVALAEWDMMHRPSGIDDGTAESRKGIFDPGSPDPIRESMLAPDFRLPSLDGEGSVGLGDYRRHKPVVLIFGSFG